MKVKTKLKIQTLKTKIAQIDASASVAKLPIEQELKKEYEAFFEAHNGVKKLLTDAELSTDYAFAEYGDLITWKRVDLEDLGIDSKDSDLLEAFSEFISEHGFYFNSKNSVLELFQGEYIGINDEGDVYHEDGKTTWIVSQKDYETIEERNALIEAYMERAGVFPGVFQIDRYGNVAFANTQKKEVNA